LRRQLVFSSMVRVGREVVLALTFGTSQHMKYHLICLRQIITSEHSGTPDRWVGGVVHCNKQWIERVFLQNCEAFPRESPRPKLLIPCLSRVSRVGPMNTNVDYSYHQTTFRCTSGVETSVMVRELITLTSWFTPETHIQARSEFLSSRCPFHMCAASCRSYLKP
jgi:hypothetical protein